MNTPSHDITTEIDLETRIVACVLGEASDFERDQVTRLIEERPELAAVKRRFENVHALLSDIGKDDFPGDQPFRGEHSIAGDSDEWKLPAEKRNALLSVFDGEPMLVQPRLHFDKPSISSRGRKQYGWFGAIATVACVACLAGLLLIPQVRSAREVSSARMSTSDRSGPMLAEDSVWFAETAPQARSESPVATEGVVKDFLVPMQNKSLPKSGVVRFDSTDDDSKNVSELETLFGESIIRSRVSGLEELDLDVAAQPQAAGVEIQQSLQSIPELKAARGQVAMGRELSRLSDNLLGEDRSESTKSYFGTEFEGRDGVRGLGFGGVGGGGRSFVEPKQQSAQNGWSEPSPPPILPNDPSGLPAGSSLPSPTSETLDFADGGFESPSMTADPVNRFAGKQPAKRKSLRSISKEEEEALGRSDMYQFEHARSKADKSNANAGGELERKLVERDAKQEPFSTFSLHVSDVSFKLAAAALSADQWPDASKIRIEEFVNAFDYGDPLPSVNEAVACRIEQSIHPFSQQRNLLRVSMRTAAAGRASTTPLRLTLLLDNSGSMERIDRQQTVRRAFGLLAKQLQSNDQVTLISFARNPRLLADRISGAGTEQLIQLVENLPSEGGTNIETALQLAFEKAIEQRLDGAQNRIVLLTDGAVNLGNANPERLSEMIATFRESGIAFDAAGISANGLNDEMLEALTRKGDGRYYLLDSVESADSGFAKQIAGALRPSAQNVKVQVEFNPSRVGRYKLLGFEKHRLKQEDFRNDAVDAAEMSAAEAGVAVYQFEPLPNGEGDVGSVSVRFRDLSTGQMVENRWPIPYQPDAPRLDQAPAPIQIASTAALFAARLRGDASGVSVDLQTLAEIVSGLPESSLRSTRIQMLRQMIQKARQLSGE